MFEYFPGNYMWSLAVNRCLASGGMFGEIHWACKDLQEAAKTGPWGDAQAWHHAWMKLAQQVEAVGDEALKGGTEVTACDAYFRAAQYYQWAEAFLPPDDDRAQPTFARHMDTFARAAELMNPRVETFDIPFENSFISAYFVPAQGVEGPAPAVMISDGLDGTKEEMFYMARAFAARGISCLAIDHPGQGATLRLGKLTARHDSEVAAGVAFDYLVKHFDVDADRVGICAASMGGYYAPRAAAFEKRFKACVAWGAIYDYHGIWVRRMKVRPGEPVSVDTGAALGTTGTHLLRILGVSSYDEALAKLEKFSLVNVASQITCDVLLVQGEDDKQTPLAEAEQLYAAIGSKSKELRVYTREEGGAAHVQLDRPEPALSRIADWFVARLASANAAR
ncbi:alpha/beta hydrolase family protein [Paraburkholderia pallida]|uniref:Alpha/beta hydrolase n=1 Tax=Paraburkholderia pallida TaxID=2547399 RepID=A0A4P7CZ67_9BURK|nr:alpha/beta fold hydrolase [Paraburkholderia pallida]QBR01629.1 alpha/beta hydrolase [Paraburkholderia pallida]